MVNKKFGDGKRVRTKDLFTLFTGLWGHEEFEAAGHRLIKLKLGSVSADYTEGAPVWIEFAAKEFGFVCDQEGKLRKKHETTLTLPVFNFDRGARPQLKLLYKALLGNVSGVGRKKLFKNRLSWNILSFVTVGPEGHKCFWSVENVGSKKEPVTVPLLVKIDKADALSFTVQQQIKIVGDGMFENVCHLVPVVSRALVCEDTL
jgi:hypothetical protein